MTYTYDTIPAKLFFKILVTEEYHLLTDEELSVSELTIIWQAIEDERNEKHPDKEAQKIINLSTKIESLKSKLEAINLAIHCLEVKQDEELIELVKKYGYSVDDLEKAKRESKAIIDKIDLYQSKMPKSKQGKENLSFDEAVMSYSAFTGSGFIDTNKITLPQYYALISMGNSKMKALKDGGQGKNNKTRRTRR